MQMLLNLHKKSWDHGLTLEAYSDHCKHNEKAVQDMLGLAKAYHKVVALSCVLSMLQTVTCTCSTLHVDSSSVSVMVHVMAYSCTCLPACAPFPPAEVPRRELLIPVVFS